MTLAASSASRSEHLMLHFTCFAAHADAPVIVCGRGLGAVEAVRLTQPPCAEAAMVRGGGRRDRGVRRPPTVLSIAGSDSSGAGVQADIKAFGACGVHGMTAITAIVAGGTADVRRVQPLSPDLVRDQVEAILGDLPVDVVKIGFVGSADRAHAILPLLDRLIAAPLVVDPVVLAESGCRLPPSALTEVRGLVDRATVATPNLSEARALAGDESLDVEQAAEAILALGAAAS